MKHAIFEIMQYVVVPSFDRLAEFFLCVDPLALAIVPECVITIDEEYAPMRDAPKVDETQE